MRRFKRIYRSLQTILHVGEADRIESRALLVINPISSHNWE
jgi:hypothetical protein